MVLSRWNILKFHAASGAQTLARPLDALQQYLEVEDLGEVSGFPLLRIVARL